jgi:hypothetical protein
MVGAVVLLQKIRRETTKCYIVVPGTAPICYFFSPSGWLI